MLSRRILALSLTIPLLFVAGCTGENTTKESASPSNGASLSSVSNSPSASPTAAGASDEYVPATLDHPAKNVPVPKYPEAAKKDDKAGREAAADYFMDALLYAKETGSAKAIDQVAYPDCPECWVFQEKTKQFYDAGGWVVGVKNDELRRYNETPGPDAEGRYQLHFHTIEAESTLRYPDNTTLDPLNEQRSESKGILWIQYWPSKKKNVILKFQTTSLVELE